MFGIGPTELIVILIIGLIVLGPERLPQVASQVGKAIRDFRRMSDDMTGEFQRTFQDAELMGKTNDASSPLLSAEGNNAAATPNGVNDNFTFNLTPQVIPTEPPATTPPDASAEGGDPSEPVADDMLIATLPIATKADPHAGASLLDEPIAEPAAEPTGVADDTVAAATVDTNEYFPSAIPEQLPIDLNADPEAAPEAAIVQAQNGIADAWDAVINTEATRSLPSSEEAAVAEAALRSDTAMSSMPEPAAEVTIREVIEAQVAAEAFRERRRVASYRRAHKGE